MAKSPFSMRGLRRKEILAMAAALAVPGGAGCTFGRAAGSDAATQDGGRSSATARAAPIDQALDRDAAITLDDAFIRYDARARTWTMGNGSFEERLSLETLPGGGAALLRGALVSRDRNVELDVSNDPDATDPAAAAPAGQDALGIGLDGMTVGLIPRAQRLEQMAGGALYATLRFTDVSSGADLTHEVRLRPGHAVVEHRSSIHHARSNVLRLTQLDSASFTVRSGANARWRAATLDNQGNISFVRLGRDGTLETETPLQSAARAPVVPLMLLHDAANEEGLFLGLRWSSNYRIAVRSIGDRRVAVEAGVRMLPNAQVDVLSAVDATPGFALHSGQTITGAWLLVGVYPGSQGLFIIRGRQRG